MEQIPTYDVVIVGSGIVGLTTALALRQAASLKIAVIEAKTPSKNWQQKEYDNRVSAIALSSQRIFEHLQVWSAIKDKRISPYYEMIVWDALGKGQIDFKAAELHEPVLGYIVEDSVIRTSLLEKLEDDKNLEYLCPLQLTSILEIDDGIVLTTSDQKSIKTKLLIAADGAESWVRQQVKIEIATKDYQHTAIITNVKTTLLHQAIARQCFGAEGILAFLPLQDPDVSSIVWSVKPDYAVRLLSLNDDEFSKQLAAAFDHQLGLITKVSTRHAFALRMRHAKHYVRNRIALVGDAAHTVHPLAGQGVNMGLLDAVALAEVVVTAYEKNRDFSSLATLRRYERWRKSDALAMLAAVDGLKRLFTNEHKWAQFLRSSGLSLTNRLAFLKNIMANYALGKRGDLPLIAQ